VNEEQAINLSTYLQVDRTYDELLELLNVFQSYKNKAMKLVDCWTFSFGK